MRRSFSIESPSGEIYNRDLHNLEIKNLEKLLDYCKYLYEEEKERTTRIEKKIDIFKIYLGGGVLLALILPISKIQLMIQNGNIGLTLGIITIVISSLSFLMYLLSFIFTLLIFKVQKFERPTKPKEAIAMSLKMVNENAFIATIIADYSVATSRNHEVNNVKANYLEKALFTFFLAVFLTVSGIIVITGFNLWEHIAWNM